MTDSSSDLSRTGAAIASTAKEIAAALKGFSQYSKYVAVAGLNRKVTLVACGAISLSSSSHLPAIVLVQRVSIRILRPSIQPSFSSPSRNAAMRACPTGSSAASGMSTPMRLTLSGRCARPASGHAAALPSSVMNSRRLTQSPRWSAVGWAKSIAVLYPRGHGAHTILPTRMERTAPLPTLHAAAPPSSMMSSRRFTRSPRRRGRAESAAYRCRAPWQS